MSQASPKFKPGEKVVCINNEGLLEYITIGKIYLILKVESNALIVRVTLDDGRDYGMYAYRFAYPSPHSLLKRFIETGEGNAEEVIKLFRDT